jgi:hypothetical protein
MKHYTLAALVLVLVAVCIITPPACAQTPTPGSAAAATATATPTPAPTPAPTDVQKLARGIFDLSFVLVLIVAAVAGALGGLVYELLILQGSLERPHSLTEDEVGEAFPYAKPTYMYDLGIWARVIIGALAAIAALLVFSPNTALELVAMAVVAGSAGTAVFRSLQDRLTTALAQADAANIRLTAAQMAGKVDEATAAYRSVRNTIVTESVSPSGTNELAFASNVPVVNLTELDKVEQLLNEAKGIYTAIQR